MTIRPLVPAAAAALAVGLAACGGFDSAASGEQLITDYIKQHTIAPAKVNGLKVKCPSGVSQKVGASYNCTVRATIISGGSSTAVAGTATVHMIAGDKVELRGKSDFNLH